MILRVLIIFILIVISIYITVAHGVRRFAALTQAPPILRDDLQFWGFVYMFVGALLFTAACALAFIWLAQALHKRSQ